MYHHRFAPHSRLNLSCVTLAFPLWNLRWILHESPAASLTQKNSLIIRSCITECTQTTSCSVYLSLRLSLPSETTSLRLSFAWFLWNSSYPFIFHETREVGGMRRDICLKKMHDIVWGASCIWWRCRDSGGTLFIMPLKRWFAATLRWWYRQLCDISAKIAQVILSNPKALPPGHGGQVESTFRMLLEGFASTLPIQKPGGTEGIIITGAVFLSSLQTKWISDGGD